MTLQAAAKLTSGDVLKGHSFTGCGKMQFWVELAFRPASHLFYFREPFPQPL
jgi:hypothetical protein